MGTPPPVPGLRGASALSARDNGATSPDSTCFRGGSVRLARASAVSVKACDPRNRRSLEAAAGFGHYSAGCLSSPPVGTRPVSRPLSEIPWGSDSTPTPFKLVSGAPDLVLIPPADPHPGPADILRAIRQPLERGRALRTRPGPGPVLPGRAPRILAWRPSLDGSVSIHRRRGGTARRQPASSP